MRLTNLERHIAEAAGELIDVRDARRQQAEFRGERGHTAIPAPMLTTGNTKLLKSLMKSLGLSLLPHRLGGVGNICPWSSPGCRKGCLHLSGRALMFPAIPKGRHTRTQFMDEHPKAGLSLIVREIELAVDRYGEVAFRPNVLADLRWELIAPWLFNKFPMVQFYDYTAAPYEVRPTELLPSNYHLTFSVKETTSDAQIVNELEHGRNATVVFADEFPASYLGFPVINGDASDERFLDPAPCVVGLKAKGKAKKDTSGFVKESPVSIA